MEIKDIKLARLSVPNANWAVFNEQALISLPHLPILNAQSKVFTIGSCFAREIRSALRAAQFDVYPNYQGLKCDRNDVRVGKLPEKDNLNFYHTFAILQEFERAAGMWKQEPADCWEIKDRWFRGKIAYQDPYRRAIYSRTPEALFDTIYQIDELVRQAVNTADIFIITLGLIEAWKKNNDGRFCCLNPGYAGGGGHSETTFHLSTYQENYRNVKETLSIIQGLNPDAQIILTVSPVPLGSTATTNDVVVANTESKALLRTVAGQVVREHDNVHYFPSYEICSALDSPYLEDGRHVRPEVVSLILDAFFKQFLADAQSVDYPVCAGGT